MILLTPIRLGVAVAAICAPAAVGQGLPATPPTSPAGQAAAGAAQAPSPPSAPQPPQQAQVAMNGGMLTVAANNSSLNQILREISRLTGMKITGGVTDERVYGSYGPADPSTVLSALVGGTGSNMMIVLNAQQAPAELVLTPRGGGPTPPNPAAAREREREMQDVPPQRQQRFPQQDGAGNMQRRPPQQAPEQGAPQQPQVPPPPTGDTTTQQSPNGVKTPQEIYDQLLKMQQTQQQQPKTQ
jgi:hypothetical protein